MLLASAKAADLGCPVAGEPVLDPVDADRPRVGEPDLPHEGERRGAVAARPGPDPQVVGVHVERADQVADALPAVVGRAVPLGPADAAPSRGRAWGRGSPAPSRRS